MKKGEKTVKGIKNPDSKLTEENVNAIRFLLKQKVGSMKSIAKIFNVSWSTIKFISIGKTWSEN